MSIPKMKKRDLMPARMKRAKTELDLVSHTFVRKRDSINPDKIGGYCFDCGTYTEYQQFQAGHFEPSSTCGAILRHHPHNIHGQAGKCNCYYNQEHVKINYTLAMIRKYGQEYVDKLRAMKHRTIKDDIFHREKMIELYKAGVEQDITDYLESL